MKTAFFLTFPTQQFAFAPLINCVIDDALLKTMPDIDQPLLQFIDVMNLLDPLLYFSHIFAVNRLQIRAVGIGVRTLRQQDSSAARHFGSRGILPKCPDTSAALPMCLTDSSAVLPKCLVVCMCNVLSSVVMPTSVYRAVQVFVLYL